MKPRRAAPPSRRIVQWGAALGLGASAVGAVVTAAAEPLGPWAAAVGAAVGALAAGLGALALPRAVSESLRAWVAGRERALEPQPPGPQLGGSRPEELLERIYAREDARLVRAGDNERARVEGELVRAHEGETAARAGERELRARAEAAEASLAEQRERLLCVVHTLSPPLAAAAASTAIALDGALGEGPQHLVSLAHGAVEAARRQVARVIREGASASEPLPPSSQSFAPRELIAALLRSLAPDAGRRGVELVVRFDAEVPARALGDGDRLAQALSAFVSWSVGRMRSGCVTVSCAVAPARPESPAQATLVLTVEDHGAPLDDSVLADLFAWPPADSRDGGPGHAALAVALRLLGHAGGAAWVEGASAVATRLAFSLPVARQKRLVAPTLYGRESVGGQRVLIVDDQAPSRAALTELSSGWRLRPTAVASAEAALEALRGAEGAGDPFDVLLVDRRLGTADEDGALLIEALGAGAASPPVLLLDPTEALARPLPERARGLVAGRVVKPVLPAELIDRLTAALAPGSAPRDAPSKGRTAAPLRAPRPAERSALRVLVAEDSAINRYFLERTLSRRGHRVTAVPDGAAAVDCVVSAGEPFDLVLMDIQMPVLDGFGAAQQLRAREQRAGGAHLPIIAVTSHAAVGQEGRILAAGFDACVPKPVDEERLFAAIVQACPAAEEAAPAGGEGGEATSGHAGAVPNAPEDAHVAAAAVDDAASSALASSAAEIADEESVFDEAKVLAFVAGDRDFLRSLVDLFVATSPKQLAAIAAAAAAGDARALERAAHQLKGSVANFAAAHAQGLAADLERRGRAGDLAGVPEAVAALEAAVGRLREALSGLAAREGA